MPLLLHLLCVLGLVVGAVLGASPPDEEVKLQRGFCQMFWYSFNGRCYKYVATDMEWADAELHCVSQEANLASVHSSEEFNFVQTLIQNFDPGNGPTWIGLSDVHKENGWMWSDGSRVGFSRWNVGQPDNSLENEHCVHANHPSGWNDYACFGLLPFVCKSRVEENMHYRVSHV